MASQCVPLVVCGSVFTIVVERVDNRAGAGLTRAGYLFPRKVLTFLRYRVGMAPPWSNTLDKSKQNHNASGLYRFPALMTNQKKIYKGDSM